MAVVAEIGVHVDAEDGGAGAEARGGPRAGRGTRERASDGEWSLKLPAKEAGASQNYIARGFGCVWNCDPLLPLAVRPGCVAAYSVDMAVTGGKPLSAYLRLSQNANASGYQFWGGVPLPRTASATFVRRQIAALFAPVFDLGGPDTAGGLFSHQNNAEGAVFLDNFSEVTLLRPLLTVSDTGPITLPEVKPVRNVVSAPRTITNGQISVFSYHAIAQIHAQSLG